MKILAIHAHPDDIEILTAGTLKQLRDKGHEIHMATMTNGDKGSQELSPQEIAAIRKEEAQKSAAILEADYTCLEFSDIEIFDDDATRRVVTEFLRRVRPDMILTASPQDYLCDHEITSEIVRTAAFVAPARNYHTGSAPVLPTIPPLYFMDPIECIDREGKRILPDFFVDITSTMETKEKMLACHASQREWLLKHHGVDSYMESMKEWAAERGKECGVCYAEGFRLYKGHAYPRENLLVQSLEKENIYSL